MVLYNDMDGIGYAQRSSDVFEAPFNAARRARILAKALPVAMGRFAAE
jgi:hypothetical protein